MKEQLKYIPIIRAYLQVSEKFKVDLGSDLNFSFCPKYLEHLILNLAVAKILICGLAPLCLATKIRTA